MSYKPIKQSLSSDNSTNQQQSTASILLRHDETSIRNANSFDKNNNNDDIVDDDDIERLTTRIATSSTSGKQQHQQQSSTSSSISKVSSSHNFFMRRRADNTNTNSMSQSSSLRNLRNPKSRTPTPASTMKSRRVYETVGSTDESDEGSYIVYKSSKGRSTTTNDTDTSSIEDNTILFRHHTTSDFDDDDDDDIDDDNNDSNNNVIRNYPDKKEKDGIFFQPLEMEMVSSNSIHSTNSTKQYIDDTSLVSHHHTMMNNTTTSSVSNKHLVLLYDWKDPWLPCILVTVTLIVPVLIGNIVLFYKLIGRIWIISLFAIHLVITVVSARILVSSYLEPVIPNKFNRFVSSISSIVDLLFFGLVYPLIWNTIVHGLFTEIDGTIVIEYTKQVQRLKMYITIGFIILILRFGIGSVAIVMRLFAVVTWAERCRSCHYRILLLPLVCIERFVLSTKFLVLPRTHYNIRQFFRWLLTLVSIVAVVLVIASLTSGINHLIMTWPSPPTQHHSNTLNFVSSESVLNVDGSNNIMYGTCDPLDTTECWLPFPSYFHAIEDSSTTTGWRVNLRSDVLPTLKGNIPLNLKPKVSVNNLDGFSTMAPMLFYMNGLKEAHEAGINQLQGPSRIAHSITNESVTILINVYDKSLVPHSAEIDYLDAQNPLVMLFPAQPLAHNTHYAVAVINAVDAQKQRLPQTAGMKRLLTATDLSINEQRRRDRYLNVLIPAIEQATNDNYNQWFNYTADPESLQLLFDFPTISEGSQLGPVRGVRDATMKYIARSEWKWKDHVRTIKVVDGDCRVHSETVARTVHAELDIPWFLNGYGPGYREAILNMGAVRTGNPVQLGVAKFVVVIPCSVRAAALSGTSTVNNDINNNNNHSNGTEHRTLNDRHTATSRKPKPIRAIMEYGHGLFANRGEVFDYFLTRMANDEGYVLTAMDWRGMSAYDLLLVAKTLLSTPMLFESVRDNLIQGYANKYALQHFTRNGMLAMDWFRFANDESAFSFTKETHLAPTLNNRKPTQVFYGISQGGILGAGYSALSGVTGLIERSILGVPGTPFALIMSRSNDFKLYDTLLLFNLYDNRHVRTFLSLVQMLWDPVEASGVLATPVNEPYPRTLLQAGLGDTIVTTFAAEALARGYHASILPYHPRTDIFGISQAQNTTNTTEPFVSTDNEQLHAVLTELLYQNDYEKLSLDNHFGPDNDVHICVRRDPALIEQIKTFVNDGIITDPCVADHCLRTQSKCY